jgi:hypothetical protein
MLAQVCTRTSRYDYEYISTAPVVCFRELDLPMMSARSKLDPPVVVLSPVALLSGPRPAVMLSLLVL